MVNSNEQAKQWPWDEKAVNKSTDEGNKVERIYLAPPKQEESKVLSPTVHHERLKQRLQEGLKLGNQLQNKPTGGPIKV